MTSRHDYMRDYQRQWARKRREAFFDGKSCARCGSTDRMELDHIDPSKKVHHAIWSWSKVRRREELSKCQVLCHECHSAKTSRFRRVLTDEQVVAIRAGYSAGDSLRKLSRDFCVDRSTIKRAVEGYVHERVEGQRIGDEDAA
tara:strand:- start:4201 stop:4629 length:429 start_codon:yes stop_codon:yes gene_type:complete